MSGVFSQNAALQRIEPDEIPFPFVSGLRNAAGRYGVRSCHSTNSHDNSTSLTSWFLPARRVRGNYRLQCANPPVITDPDGYGLRVDDMEGHSLPGFRDGAAHHLPSGKCLWCLPGEYDKPGWRRDPHSNGRKLADREGDKDRSGSGCVSALRKGLTGRRVICETE